ncbi:MAG: Gfo/Idh/MocA family oxidoreductase [Candidatus Latescibacteria bacterium]|jgi:predicted dehydrogenase|nr:Gfo/Idh/MocA family oxidoreductase [Candidatus Latescibacterota bacterium]
MAMKRIAVAGAGNMARSRGKAFLETGQAEICAVAARHTETAQACASELGCDSYYDDYRRLEDAQPDAILIETPHKVQDEISLWALEAGFDLLIGGSLASSVGNGERFVELAARQSRVVEAGYQRRYDPAWEEIHRIVGDRALGEPVMAVGMALWNADPQAWYYDQDASGGMPLTHMSYCYLNAIRWIMGTPTAVSAMANQKVETAPGRVLEETCATLIQIEGGSFISATASYAGPDSMDSAETRFLCTNGGVRTNAQDDPGLVSITVYRGSDTEVRSFKDEPSPFVRQAETFLDALDSRGEGRNPPGDALVDLKIAEAISVSTREQRSVSL